MIELLILFELSKKVLTMYGISKEINKNFSVLTTPSFGTIKPALTRLSDSDFIKSQKTISKGGRPSVYYSITKSGIEELKHLLTDQLTDNPVQFLTTARIRLMCADILDNEKKMFLLRQLKTKAESILIDTQNIVKTTELSYYPRIVFDNMICEYKNFISMIEGFEHAGNC